MLVEELASWQDAGGLTREDNMERVDGLERVIGSALGDEVEDDSCGNSCHGSDLARIWFHMTHDYES